MRREAAAISVSELDRRLPVPPDGDELTRLGTTLNEMLARLEESFRRETQLVGLASHELRTPLGVLKMEMDLALSRARTPEEMRAALRNASRETDRLVRLAEDLLVLGRMRGGRLPVRRVPVALDGFVTQICTAYEARARLGGVSLHAEADGTTVSIDPSRVRQAVEDLLDNALRFTPAGGRVEVAGRSSSGGVRIEVRGSGPGFPASMLERGLEPFTSQPAHDGTRAGSGLGLSIVSVVAASHGGTVELRNDAGGGARVAMVIEG
jgi:two-component system, OmpR family, sensor kinase